MIQQMEKVYKNTGNDSNVVKDICTTYEKKKVSIRNTSTGKTPVSTNSYIYN